MRRPQTRPCRRDEDELQRMVVQWLSLARPGCLWCAIPNGGQRSRLEAAIMTGLGVRAGAPDLVFVWSAGAGFIELKRPGGRLSRAQRDWQQECSARGVPYIVASSLEEVIDAIKGWGLLPERRS